MFNTRAINLIIKLIAAGCLLSSLLIACKDDDKDPVNKLYSLRAMRKDLKIFRTLINDVHGNPYQFISKERFEELTDSVSGSITGSMTIREFYNKVDFLVDQLHCTHTACFFPGPVADSLGSRPCYFPVPLILIGDSVYLNSKGYNAPYGSAILSIDHHPMNSIVEQLNQYMHTDGISQPYKDMGVESFFAWDYYLRYGPSDSFLVAYRDAETGERKNTIVQADSYNNIERDKTDYVYFTYDTDVPYDLQLLAGDNLAIMRINSFGQETFTQADAFSHFLENSFSLLRLRGITNLIVDYRNNGGGYFRSSYELLSYFIKEPVLQFDSVTRRFSRLPYPNLVAAEDSADKLTIDTSYKDYTAISGHRYLLLPENTDTCFPAPVHFNGKVFVVTNGSVISAAASSAALLKEKAGAVIVGEETGGGYNAFNSETLTYTLPNTGLQVEIPCRHYVAPLTHKEYRNGVVPDYFRPLTKADFMDFNDGPIMFIKDTLIKGLKAAAGYDEKGNH